MTGARIDNDKRALARVYFYALRRQHTDKTVVHRTTQCAPVHDELVAEPQDMGCGLGRMLLIALPALPQDVTEQDAPLARIGPIGPGVPSLIDGPFGDGVVERDWILRCLHVLTPMAMLHEG